MTERLNYEDLTPVEQAWMFNGVGPKDGPDLPDLIFYEASCRHDFDYWSGFSDMDRSIADKRFLDAMLAAASRQSGWWSRQFYKIMAWRYYSAVRWLGRGAFCYRQAYGTREDLIQDMAGVT